MTAALCYSHTKSLFKQRLKVLNLEQIKKTLFGEWANQHSLKCQKTLVKSFTLTFRELF